MKSRSQKTEMIVIKTISLESRNMTTATLVEEMKPVVTEKDKFEDQNKSSVKLHFGVFGLTKLQYREQK